jgi:predicted ABC-type ATPase
VPNLYIIAGPNGAGKTYWLKNAFLEHKVPSGILVNADIIQESIIDCSPLSAALRASRKMLSTIQEHVNAGEDFAIETTLAARTYVKKIRNLRKNQYSVYLCFLWVDSVDTCIERVANRVRAGGHDIPEDVIRRRFDVGLRNFFELYQPLVHHWELYDYSSFSKRTLIASYDRLRNGSPLSKLRVLRPGFHLSDKNAFAKILAQSLTARGLSQSDSIDRLLVM